MIQVSGTVLEHVTSLLHRVLTPRVRSPSATVYLTPPPKLLAPVENVKSAVKKRSRLFLEREKRGCIFAPKSNALEGRWLKRAQCSQSLFTCLEEGDVRTAKAWLTLASLPPTVRVIPSVTKETERTVLWRWLGRKS